MTKLRYSLSLLVIFGGLLSLSPANAADINCRDFAALSGVSTHEDYKKSKSNEDQFNAYIVVIANHAGLIASLRPLSRRNAALQLVLQNEEMKSFVIGNAFEMTINTCVDRRNVSMRDVAIEQFDYLLDAIEKEMGN